MSVMKHMSQLTRIVAAAAVFMTPATGSLAQAVTDTGAIRRIQEEGAAHSQVMETARMLTDVYGPRLTGSALNAAAGEWAMKRLRDWGLSDVHPEYFAFDRPSWINERYYVQVTSPAPFPVVGMAAAWSAPTDSMIKADVVIARIRTAPDTLKVLGSLEGKVVLSCAPFEGHNLFSAPSVQLTPDLLGEMSRTRQEEYLAREGLLVELNVPRADPPTTGRRLPAQAISAFLKRQSVAAVLCSFGGSGGVFDVRSAASNGPTEIHVAPEHYSRIYRTVESGIPVGIEMDIRNSVSSSPARPFNVLADLPGTDLRNEVVIIGAHLDSWVGATGATDNAAGVAVMMEAMRILKASKVPLRRTVRIGLWNGEEQMMRGSGAYATQHFGAREYQGTKVSVTPGPDYASFSAYLNLDRGAGPIRAIDTWGNESVKPLLEKWVQVLSACGFPITHVLSVGNDDSDSSVFKAYGPSLYFHQDPLDYYRGTHHTSQDLYDRLVPKDLETNAIIVAGMVYLTANHPAKLPK